ncbi:hypothetical protein ACVZDL_02025 [Escherichia coli]
MLEQLKADVLAANLALPAHHLVTGRAGSPAWAPPTPIIFTVPSPARDR